MFKIENQQITIKSFKKEEQTFDVVGCPYKIWCGAGGDQANVALVNDDETMLFSIRFNVDTIGGVIRASIVQHRSGDYFEVARAALMHACNKVSISTNEFLFLEKDFFDKVDILIKTISSYLRKF